MKKAPDAWTGPDHPASLSRPSSLFPGESFSSQHHHDVKDLYLQDLSDSESFSPAFIGCSQKGSMSCS